MADRPRGPDEHPPQAEYSRELRAVAKGGGLDLLAQLAQQLIALIAGPVMTRLLGLAGYGFFTVSERSVEVLGLILRLGYPSAIARYVGIYDGEGKGERARAVVTGTVTTSLVLGCAASAVVVIWPEWVSGLISGRPEMSPVLRMLALALPAMLAASLLAQATVARLTVVYRVAANLLGRLVTLAGVIVLCGPLKLGAVGAAFSVLVASALGAAVTVVGALQLFGSLSLADLRYYDFVQVQLFALPLLLAQLSQFGMHRINPLIGARWLTPVEWGKYGAASRVATIGSFGLTSIGAIFSPIIADLHNRGKMAELREMFQTAARWVYHMTFPVMLIAIFKAKSIMWVFRPEAVDAAFVLQLLCLGQIVNASVGNAGRALAMSGYQWLVAANNTALAVVNIVLCIVLTSSYGLFGMALGAMVATAAVNLVRGTELWYLHRMTAYTPKVVKPLLAAAITCPLLLLKMEPVWWDLTLPVLGFGIAYVVVVLLLGLEDDDREVLAALRRKLLTAGNGE